MKRARIGNTDIDLDAPYWTGGKNSRLLRKSEVVLYAELDLDQERADIAYLDSDVEEIYNEMDIIYCELQAIQAYGDDEDLLVRSMNILGLMVEAGDFAKAYGSLDERNSAVNALVETMFCRTVNYNTAEVAPEEWCEWVKTHIIDFNHYTDPRVDGRLSQPYEQTAAVGETYNYDYYSAKAKENGPYFLYSVAKNVAENETPEVRKKRLAAIRYMNWFESCNTGMSYVSQKYNYKAGIIKSAGVEPEVVVDGFRAEAENHKKVAGIGALGTFIMSIGVPAFVALIMGCVAALIALIKGIVEIVSALKGKNAPSEKELKANAAMIQDWQQKAKELDNTAEDFIDTAVDAVKDNWILIAGAVAAAWFIMS